MTSLSESSLDANHTPLNKDVYCRKSPKDLNRLVTSIIVLQEVLSQQVNRAQQKSLSLLPTNMDTLNEDLIAAVQKRQPLYDKSDDNYSNRVFIAKQFPHPSKLRLEGDDILQNHLFVEM
ncbi:hypothetical protein RRG08_036341 [Elysia crispata]|uniref:Uncharacterized protein n=1 Tax=Elysia crispata TaxID=231223 RepID=A0AAE1DKR8_9GAST|nr:hypothetical protein RRG08_036341 [Elysia crispata]